MCENKSHTKSICENKSHMKFICENKSHMKSICENKSIWEIYEIYMGNKSCQKS